MLIDTHCHLQFMAYKDDYDIVAKKCEQKNMILNLVGSQKDTSKRAVKMAEDYSFIYATVGLHPIHLISTEIDEAEIQFKTREEDFDYAFYKDLANHPKVIAIGECGLELYHLPKNINKQSALNKQKEVFLAQHDLAQELDLPLVIHVRDAHKQMIDLLKSIPNNQRRGGVIHCFTDNWNTAKEYLDLGFYIGFTGVITFPAKKTDPKTQESLMEVVKNCPLNRVLIETDAPYLAPQAHRGKRCEPWMVEEVAKKFAEIRNISTNEMIKITTDNALKLFTKIKNR